MKREWQDKTTRSIVSILAGKSIAVSDNVKIFRMKSRIYPEDKMLQIYTVSRYNMTAVDAMSVHLTVIVIDIPPYRELLKSISDYPLYISPASSQDIADAIKMIIVSPDFYRVLSEKLIKRTQQLTIIHIIYNYSIFYRPFF